MTSSTRAAALTRVLSQSGRYYLIERTLQNRPIEHGRVYLATFQGQKYVLKSVASDQFQYYKDMFNDLRSSPYIRHFTSYDKADTKRRLRGIDALHDKGIVHTDIKPNNILVDWKDEGDDITIEQVQLADIEDAAYIPEDCVIEGAQRGNWMWRSPEAHVSGPMHKPTDIFSFGLVCIYAMTKQVVLAVDEEKLPEGTVLEDVVIERQLSYFSDWKGLCGLVKYFGDTPKGQYFAMVAGDFNVDNPMRPFDNRTNLEPELNDLIMRMMNVNPTQRLTAKEALVHSWFAEVSERIEETSIQNIQSLQLDSTGRDHRGCEGSIPTVI